ncbi:MAG TPA: phosphatidylinositol mannoside acyltransferase [Actinomycetota bacterium]|nr:phosphatidylinositol mannoside acyltransferase [Actinomycetota bacterium]
MTRERETLRERVAVGAHRLAEQVATTLPEAWGRKVFAVGGALAYHAAPGARRVVAGNLSRVLGRSSSSPVVQRAVREAFDSYARYWFDSFRSRVIPREEFLRRSRFEGAEHLEAAMERGRGAIVALPHLGNWDTAGRWVAEQGYHITAVAEELKPERMYRLFYRHRRALGMGIVPLSDARKVGEDLVKLLSQNQIVALVCDRDLKNTGVEVEMFGAKRRMPAGPALLSLATGAPLLPCAPRDEEDGWIARIHPPLEIDRTGKMRDDVSALTRALAKRFERDISAYPTQWHMFQPAWPDAG